MKKILFLMAVLFLVNASAFGNDTQDHLKNGIVAWNLGYTYIEFAKSNLNIDARMAVKIGVKKKILNFFSSK
jgi:hypothetical protein